VEAARQPAPQPGAAGLLAVLLGEWWQAPALASGGTLLVLAILLLPGLLALLAQGLGKPRELPWGVHLRALAAAGGRTLGHAFLALAFLPYDAWVSLDAIGRTLLRLLVTRRRLLQWQTSGDAERSPHSGLAGFYATMWIVPLAALAGGSLLVGQPPADVLPALPLLGLWAAAPWLAWWISRPLEVAAPDLTSEPAPVPAPDRAPDLALLRHLCHCAGERAAAGQRTGGPGPHHRRPHLAHQHRPRPAGQPGRARPRPPLAGRLAQRTRATLDTLQRLERHRGHFFNWYDTRTLQPLLPRYVSSVDSGNLAGHLLTLGAGLREQADAPLFPPQLSDGLHDTLRLLREHAPAHAGLARLDAEWADAPPDLPGALAWLQRITAVAMRAAAELASAGEPAAGWVQSFRRQCEAQLAELVQIAPAPAGLAPPSPAATLRLLAREPGPAGVRAAQRLQELEALAVQCDALADMDFHLPVRPGPASLCHRLRRDRAPPRHQLLRPAGLGGAAVQLRGHRARPGPAGPLVLAGPPAGGRPRRAHPGVVERLHVRVPDAAAGHAHLCGHAAGPDLPRGGAAADRLRPRPRRALGHLGVGLQRTDAHLTYQYRAFGVPGLGLKRGLAEDLVVAPYASALALMVAPQAACENLQQLAAEGRCGPFGFYEAVDYTRARLPPGESSSTVRSYMAHHQGMTLLALNHLLRGAPMPRRFLACPLLHAADLLLQERVPRSAPGVPADDLTLEETRLPAGAGEFALRVVRQPGAPAPEVHLLSNGRYHVVISSAGGGYSRWRDLAVTRWREDATRDCWGTFLYLRDLSSGAYWSCALQPTAHATRGYEAIFTQARAEFRQQLAGLEVHTEISVSPEDDVEVRRITVTNRGSCRAHHRADQLRRGRAGQRGLGRGASGVQQPVRADGVSARRRGPAGHPPRPRAGENGRPGCCT
jgi:cyclic beta-1,2-glucan synthetase